MVLSAIIVVLYCAYRLASKKPTQAPEPTPEAPAGSLSPDQTEAPGRHRREGTYTFLLAASDQSSGNADTIIVASYDTEAQKVGMVSVPRDTLLESGKINAAYHKGPRTCGIPSPTCWACPSTTMWRWTWRLCGPGG